MEQLEELINSAKETNSNQIVSFFKELSPSILSAFWHLLLALVIFSIGRRLIEQLIIRMDLLNDRHSQIDLGLRKFIQSLLKVCLWALLIYVIASLLGIPTASFVALLGSAGVAIGLALQGSLSNFAGGIMLLFLHPFRVKDYIKSGDYEGTVIDIGLFYTTLQKVDNVVVSIPNGSLANGNIINYSANKERMIQANVGIAYEQDLEKSISVLKEMLETNEVLIRPDETCVFVKELGDSAVTLEIRYWVPTNQYAAETRRINGQIKKALDKHDISIPYNQLDVHIVP